MFLYFLRPRYLPYDETELPYVYYTCFINFNIRMLLFHLCVSFYLDYCCCKKKEKILFPRFPFGLDSSMLWFPLVFVVRSNFKQLSFSSLFLRFSLFLYLNVTYHANFYTDGFSPRRN